MWQESENKSGFGAFWSKYSTKVLLITAAILFLVASGVVFGYYYLNQVKKVDTNVVAVVGDKKFTNTDLGRMIYGIDFGGKASKAVTNEQKRQFIDYMVESEIYNLAAKRLGITVSDKEVENQAKSDISEYASYTATQKETVRTNTRNKLLRPKVAAAVISTQSGQYAELRYDKYWNEAAGVVDAKTADLKAQIKPIAEDMYARLKAGTITFEQAVDEIHANKVVDIAGNPSLLGRQGGSFDSRAPITRNPEFPENVNKMSVGEIKLFNISLSNGTELKDGAFIIAKLTKKEVKEANSVAEWLANEKNKLKVGVYYENAK